MGTASKKQKLDDLQIFTKENLQKVISLPEGRNICNFLAKNKSYKICGLKPMLGWSGVKAGRAYTWIKTPEGIKYSRRIDREKKKDSGLGKRELTTETSRGRETLISHHEVPEE